MNKKVDREFNNDPDFQKFCQKLFHSSLQTILEPLQPSMTTPKVSKCSDGHFQHVIYGLGPYIADYQEQVLLGCIVQGWCVQYVFSYCVYDVSYECKDRCTADKKNLDGKGVWQSHEHTQLLMDAFNVKTLWDDHGVVGNILVSQILFYGIILTSTNCTRSHLQHLFHVQIFMSSWCQTSSIKLLRVFLKIILLSGLASI